MTALFSAELLREKLAGFSLNKIPDLAGKRATLLTWIAQMRSGKLAKQKEEAVKSRFVADIFGKVLGFNANSVGEWQLEEEKRTPTDATKPDAALGYFSAEAQEFICRAVIEMKGAATDLDKKQPRQQALSAVSQAFEYSIKMGAECRWVIVSNLQEIRFYYHNDYNRCQRYRLDELDQEDQLKELLFLFHKDRFLARRGKSKTERLLEQDRPKLASPPALTRHVVAELEECILQFSGLPFVDPHYLAALPPFNILPQHVRHYHRGTLFTINPRLCHLLENVHVEDGQLRISEALAQELREAGIGDGARRLTAVFEFLNHCHITGFQAVRDYQAIARRNARTLGFSRREMFSFEPGEGVSKAIYLLGDAACACPQCQYRSLDLSVFLGWLKSSGAHTEAELLALAYGHYLAGTNGFKEAYQLYGQLEQQAEARQEKGIPYFLARYNRRHLHNLLEGHYGHADSEQLLAGVRAIDLVTVVTDELEAVLPAPVRDYLLLILDDRLLRRVERQVQETSEELRERSDFLRSGGHFDGPNYLAALGHEYALLYLHLNRNFIVADAFRDYRDVARLVLQAVLLDYATPEQGARRVALLYLEEAIFNVNPADLQKLLAKTKRLRTSRTTRNALLGKLSNLLRSCSRRTVFGDSSPNPLVQEFLHQRHFRDKLANVFANLLIVGSRLRMREGELADIPTHLVAFLQVEELLHSRDVKPLATFLKRQGQAFGEKNLVQLLELALRENRGHRLRYYGLLDPLVGVLTTHYPAYRLTDVALLRQAFAACDLNGNHHAGLRQLARVAPLTEGASRDYLQRRFEARLAEGFEPDLYQHLLQLGILRVADTSDYFRQLVEHLNRVKGPGFTGFRNGHADYQDVYLHNFALLVYGQQLDFRRPELALFTRLSGFERWLLNPLDFDYAQFEVDWLRAIQSPLFFARLRRIRPLVRALQTRIAGECHPDLYRLYFRHFAPATAVDPLLATPGPTDHAQE